MVKINFFTVITVLSVFMLLLVPKSSSAQMFSIGDADPRTERTLGSFTIIGIGWEIADFSFAGTTPDNNIELLDFNNNILRFSLDSPGLNLSFGIGGSVTGMENNSYLNLNGRLYSNIGLVRESGFILTIPFQLTTDLKSVRSDRTDRDFQQSSLTLGSGLRSLIKLSDRLQLNASATPNIGFSFSQGALFGGSLFRFDAKSALLINRVFGQNALSIGYDFDYRRYRIDEGLNDYDYISHLITIGIGF